MADPPIDTASLEALSITDKHRPNLPLPRELRDEIYGYLLHSKHTRVPRSYPSNQTQFYTRQGYKFHTNILAFNHAIHEEAEEYLYKNNRFVVASFEWPQFMTGSFGGLIWVPVVSQKHAAKMQHHSLRLHLTLNLGVRYQDATGKAIKISMEPCLLMAEDFDALCNTMLYQLQPKNGFAIIVRDDDLPAQQIVDVLGKGSSDNSRMIKPPSLKVQFRDTRFTTANTELQQSLVESLGKIVCSSMRVTFSGDLRCGDETYVRKLKDAMGPVLITLQADAWTYFEYHLKAKNLADEAASMGELHLATHCYLLVQIELNRSLNTSTLQGRISLTTQVGPAAPLEVIVKPMWYLLLDILCTVGYLQTRLGQLEFLAKTAENLDTWLLTSMARQLAQNLNYGEEYVSHIRFLADLYSLKPGSNKITVGKAIARLRSLEHTPYSTHDLDILTSIPDKEAQASVHLTIDKCSASQLEPPRFSFHLHDDVPKKPVYMVGLQNLDKLSRLDTPTKKEINQIQTWYRAKVTQWD